MYVLCIEKSNENFADSTWVESDKACRQHGGQILNKGIGWSNIKAWTYTSGMNLKLHFNLYLILECI